MSGPQVIEVVVIDSDINDTDEAKGEPDVTINGSILRMVQAVDGNWYGYFASQEMADIADGTAGTGAGEAGTGLDFGSVCSVEQGAANQSPAETFVGVDLGDADGVAIDSDNDCATPSDDDVLNVVREAKDVNTNVPDAGQIDINEAAWPFIQLYDLNPTGNVVVQYNKGGGAQTTTLTFDTVDNFADLELDKSSYGQGDEVHVTVTDLWLNIDPTDEDSWTFGTDGEGSSADSTTHYQVFNENGDVVGNSASNLNSGLTETLDDLMCEDNCRLISTVKVQGSVNVITLSDNADAPIENDGVPQDPFNWNIPGADAGNVPITITEQGPNSGVFGSYDESDDSNIRITNDAKRGTSASIDYNETPTTILVAFAFGSIDIALGDDEWNSGEEVPVVLVDGDANLNSRADEDLNLNA
jgi:hypothetical protein